MMWQDVQELFAGQSRQSSQALDAAHSARAALERRVGACEAHGSAQEAQLREEVAALRARLAHACAAPDRAG
eukprot:COSAG01_NODE_5028_length_4537_cov_4.829428_5_plen_72_part_00